MIAILAITAAGVAGLVPRSGQAVEAKAFTQRLVAMMRSARTAAIASGRDRVVLVDVARRAVWSEGEPARGLAVPGDIGVRVISAASERRGADVSGVRFYPNGGSSGGAIELVRGAATSWVRVNWLTGRIEHDAAATGRVSP